MKNILFLLMIVSIGCKSPSATTATSNNNDVPNSSGANNGNSNNAVPGVDTQRHTRHDSDIQKIVDWYEGIKIQPNLTDNYPINYSLTNIDVLENNPTCKNYPDGTKEIIIHGDCNNSNFRRELCVLRAINKCIEGYRADKNLTTLTIPNPSTTHTNAVLVSFTNDEYTYELVMFQYWCNRNRILTAHFYNDYSLLKQLPITSNWNCAGTSAPSYPSNRSYYDGWSTSNY